MYVFYIDSLLKNYIRLAVMKLAHLYNDMRLHYLDIAERKWNK